jgi:hypothetical protein
MHAKTQASPVGPTLTRSREHGQQVEAINHREDDGGVAKEARQADVLCLQRAASGRGLRRTQPSDAQCLEDYELALMAKPHSENPRLR